MPAVARTCAPSPARGTEPRAVERPTVVLHTDPPVPPSPALAPATGAAAATRLGWDAGWQRTLDDSTSPTATRPTRPAGRPGLPGRPRRVRRPRPGDHGRATRHRPVVHDGRPRRRRGPVRDPATGDWVLLVPHHGESAAAAVVGGARRCPGAPRSSGWGSPAPRTPRCWPRTPTSSPWCRPWCRTSTSAGSSGCSRWPGRPARGRWSCSPRPTCTPTRRPRSSRSRPAPPAATCCRSRHRTTHGLEPLRALLADGATVALLGASGVGQVHPRQRAARDGDHGHPGARRRGQGPAHHRDP